MKKTLLLLLLCAVISPSVAPAQVLLENFRNFDCANCKIPDEELEKFIADHPEYNATLIFYHNRDPYPFDPFFLAAKDDVLARNSLYSVAGNPTVHVGGYFAGSGGDKLGQWKTFTTDASQTPSPATTEISRVYNGDSTFTITVSVTGSSVGAEVRPYLLIAESGLIAENSKGYGVPASGVWDNIFRDSLGATAGGGAFVLGGARSITYTLDARGKDWKLENLRAVAFLQSTAMMAPKSFPIIGVKATNTGFFSISSVKRPDLVDAGNAFPNPFSGSVAIPFSLKAPGHVTVRISDLLGRQVVTLIDRKVSELESSVYFAPQSPLAATYVASIFVDGVLASTQKLVYTP